MLEIKRHVSHLFAGATILTVAALCTASLAAQVFVVGQKTATSGKRGEFHPTDIELEQKPLDELGMRTLIRMLEAEQGFAARPLPMGHNGVTLTANGPLMPGPEKYDKELYDKGTAAGPGARVIITKLDFKGDRIIVDLNGGPDAPHRFLQHIGVGGDANTPGNPVVQQTAAPEGARVTLVFAKYIPDVSPAEVKALLFPVINFGFKSEAEAYADTLPDALKLPILSHKVLVGMNKRMVIAAVGQPEKKLRESEYEEWIYGEQPQTVQFVRFQKDRVVRLEIAVAGRPLEVRDHDETGGFLAPLPERSIAMGDGSAGQQKPPTLLKPGEAVQTGGAKPVQFPQDKTNKPADPDQPTNTGTTQQHLVAVSGGR